jgi:hypothetical protein
VRFHVTRNDDGQPVDFYVRVTICVPKRNYNGPAHCQCVRLFPVVMTSVGVEHLKQGAKYDRQKFVCECHGEIVP